MTDPIQGVPRQAGGKRNASIGRGVRLEAPIQQRKFSARRGA